MIHHRKKYQPTASIISILAVLSLHCIRVDGTLPHRLTPCLSRRLPTERLVKAVMRTEQDVSARPALAFSRAAFSEHKSGSRPNLKDRRMLSLPWPAGVAPPVTVGGSPELVDLTQTLLYSWSTSAIIQLVVRRPKPRRFQKFRLAYRFRVGSVSCSRVVGFRTLLLYLFHRSALSSIQIFAIYPGYSFQEEPRCSHALLVSAFVSLHS